MSQKEHIKKIKESYKQMAVKWRTFTPPVRPSKAEIYFYEYKIRELIFGCKKRNLKALVLGATPEFRDLLAQYKDEIQTTLIDNNEVSVGAMNLLMQKKNPEEKIVLGNWLKMPFPVHSFDLVFSDSAQDNIPFKVFDQFFEAVHKILKPTGYWFFGAVNLDRKDGINFAKYLHLYRKNPRYFRKFQNFVWRLFQLAKDNKFYDAQSRVFDFHKVDLAVQKLVQEGKLPQAALKDLCLNVNYVQPIISQDEFKKILAKKFLVLAQMRDDSHPAMQIKWTAILKPKK